MDNETFMAICMAVVFTAIIMGGIMYYANKHKGTGFKDTTMVEIMKYLGAIVTEVYNEYNTMGGIKSDEFQNDAEYRKAVLDYVIEVIIRVAAKNGITVDIDKTLLTGLAALVVEKILDMYELQKKNGEIDDLNAKIVTLEDHKKKPALSNEKGVTVSLGDFYNEE